jgi:hypothetical protein
MRLSKLLWLTVGATAFLAARPARAPACDDYLDQFWAWCNRDFLVTWYIPAPPYPNYFGPPYPTPDYQVVPYAGLPIDTANIVRERLITMGIYPPPPPPKEQLPPPKADGKEKLPPPPPDK